MNFARTPAALAQARASRVLGDASAREAGGVWQQSSVAGRATNRSAVWQKIEPGFFDIDCKAGIFGS